MVKFEEENNLKTDKITNNGKDQDEHDKILKEFLEAAKVKNICYKDDKSISSTYPFSLFGYAIVEGDICPNSELFNPLSELPPPRIPSPSTGTVLREVLLLLVVDPSIIRSNQAYY